MLSLLLTSILPALLPAAVDVFGVGAKALINKVAGGTQAQPNTFEDRLALGQQDIERLGALAALDKVTGTPSQWVIDLRSSARYIAVFAILAAWMLFGGLSLLGYISAASEIVLTTAELARMAFFFLFGDRVYRHLKKK